MILILAIVIFVQHEAPAIGGDKDAATISLNEGWECRWGDSPFDSAGVPVWSLIETDSPEWKPCRLSAGMSHPDGLKTVWLRNRIPDRDFRDPALFLASVQTIFEVYVDSRLVHRFGEFRSENGDTFVGFGLNLIRLPENSQGKELLIRVHSTRWGRLGMSEGVRLNNYANLLVEVVGDQADLVVLGLFFVIIGSFYTVVFFVEIRRTAFYSFGHFAFFTGLYGLAKSKMILLHWPDLSAINYFVEVVSLFLVPVGILIFIENNLRSRFMIVVHWFWKICVLFVAVVAILALVDFVYVANAVRSFQLLILTIILIVFFVVIEATLDKSRLARAFATGIILLGLVGVHDLVADMGLIPAWHNLFPWGVLLFIVIVGYVMQRRFTQHFVRIEREKSRLKEAKLRAAAAELQAKLSEAQAQSMRSEKMAALGQLTAGVAHEIKNPLNFVKNFAEVSSELCGELLDGLKSEAGHDKMIGDIVQALDQNCKKIAEHSQRADSIVKGMLLHARASTGEKIPTDINQLVEQFFRLSYHAFRAEDSTFIATVDTTFDPGAKPISIVPQDMSRALVNIFNNAFYAVNEKRKTSGADYTPKVHASTQQRKDFLEIRIRDNGDGIPEAIREKVFHPFFTTKNHPEGTGLGLSISYDIVVDMHGGKLRVESQEGHFTEFIIELKS